MDEAEQRISDIEDKLNEAEKKREMKAKEHNLRIREISDSLKRNNIRIIGVPEEEEREIGIEGLCEQIIPENFPNLGKEVTFSFFLLIFLMFIYFWERKRQRDRALVGEGQRERETQSPLHTPGSELSAHSPMQGSNPQTMISWPEQKSDA